MLFTNLRFFPMIISLLPRLNVGRSILNNIGVSHLVTATSWAWCMERIGSLPTHCRTAYFYGFSITCWVLGVFGTATGLFLTGLLPPLLKMLSLYIAPLYMLLLLIGVRGHRLVALLAGGSIGLILFKYGTDWYLPIAALTGGACGFLVRNRT